MELRLAPCERDCLQDILDMTISSFVMDGACQTMPSLMSRLGILETRLLASSLLLLEA